MAVHKPSSVIQIILLVYCVINVVGIRLYTVCGWGDRHLADSQLADKTPR